MRETIILCTYNRCQSLAIALTSVAELVLPESDQWDVVVVDNNSNDRTREVVEDFCERYPGRFGYLFEPRPGKSNALNTGIANARGEILAFMDDDVQVDAGWLNNLAEAIRNRACAGVGGRILPELGFVPTAWMDSTNPYGLAPLAVFDRGADAAELNESPFGTNMAFRREVFEKYGGFRTDLGPRPGTEIRNEDTEFGARLLSAGEHLWYEPAAVVYHSIPKNRVRREYFQAWWFDKGRANIREDGIPNDSKWRIAGIPTYLLRRIAVWVARWITEVRSRNRFSAKLKVWCLAGQIVECHRQANQV